MDVRGARATLAAVLCLSVASAEPCEVICSRASPDQALAAYSYVLLGKVLEARWEGGEGHFTIEPVRVWKGWWPGDKTRFRLHTHGGSASCGYPMVEEAYYIIYATAEPQEVGLCHHEPLPLSHGLRDVAALDRARHLTPLELPAEALLAPWELACPTDPVSTMIDRALAKAELVVVGRITSVDTLSHPDGHTVATGLIENQETLKGKAGRLLHARFQYESFIQLTPTAPAIWFIGRQLPDGRRLVTSSHWTLESQGSIESRLRRWKVLGHGCEEQP